MTSKLSLTPTQGFKASSTITVRHTPHEHTLREGLDGYSSLQNTAPTDVNRD